MGDGENRQDANGRQETRANLYINIPWRPWRPGGSLLSSRRLTPARSVAMPGDVQTGRRDGHLGDACGGGEQEVVAAEGPAAELDTRRWVAGDREHRDHLGWRHFVESTGQSVEIPRTVERDSVSIARGECDEYFAGD